MDYSELEELDLYKTYTVEELHDVKCDSVKFVRVAGEYRFCGIMANHKSLVKDGEKALSAGFIRLLIKKGVRYFQISGSSSTLKVYPDDHDEDRLALVLDRKAQERSFD